jgi:hypothetical protein
LRFPVRAAGRCDTPCPSERGQVLVEFAIVAPFLALVVGGVLQFGVALNYWHDMHRIANEGARWAAVNEYPGCPGDGPATPCEPTLQTYLGRQPRADASVAICYEEQNGVPGPAREEPVTVRLTAPFTLIPLVDIGTIDLTAAATMRLEEEPTRYSVGAC